MNKINWILRLKNKTTLTTLIVGIVTFVYLVLGCFDIVPPISQDQTTQYVLMLIDLLFNLGIIVDPTTAGIGDSQQALNYTAPKKDTVPNSDPS